MTTQEKCWMLSLGQIPVPKNWYIPGNDSPYKIPKVRPSRGGEGFDRSAMDREFKRLETVIKIILKSGDRITAGMAYQIVIKRNVKFLPTTIYGTRLSESRFAAHYNKIRAKMGVINPRLYRRKFVEENYLELSSSEIAIYLGTTHDYVKQTIGKIKNGK